MEFVRRVRAGLKQLPIVIKKKTNRLGGRGRSFLGKAFDNSHVIGMPLVMLDDNSDGSSGDYSGEDNDEEGEEETEEETEEQSKPTARGQRNNKENSKVGTKRRRNDPDPHIHHGHHSEDDEENTFRHQNLVIDTSRDDRTILSKQKLQEHLAKKRSLGGASTGLGPGGASGLQPQPQQQPPPRADRRFETDRALAGVYEFDPEDYLGTDPVVDKAHAETSSASRPGPVVTDDSKEERAQMRDFLFSKVRHNHVDVVDKCIAGRRHNMQALDEKGNTVLHICAQNNLKKMASLLMRDAGFQDDEWLNLRNAKVCP